MAQGCHGTRLPNEPRTRHLVEIESRRQHVDGNNISVPNSGYQPSTGA
jgi:hypothetical protein